MAAAAGMWRLKRHGGSVYGEWRQRSVAISAAAIQRWQLAIIKAA